MCIVAQPERISLTPGIEASLRAARLNYKHIADRLLVPDRIAVLLAEIVQKRTVASGEVQDRIDQLSRLRKSSGASMPWSKMASPIWTKS